MVPFLQNVSEAPAIVLRKSHIDALVSGGGHHLGEG